MRILWDFRLFSYGYANRGVGRYTRWSSSSILGRDPRAEFFVWADRDRLPEEMRQWPVTWIPYRSGSWRSDLLRVPLLVKRWKVDLIHYWIALGPIYHIGMGLIPACRSCATVYDLGVECWDGNPFLASRKRSWYWRIQKHLARGLDGIVCISHHTRADVQRILECASARTSVMYVPVDGEVRAGTNDKRENYFLALGGSPNKNLPAVLEALRSVRSSVSDARMVVCGELDSHEADLVSRCEGAHRDPMSAYESHLRRAQGLIFCSTHEGLGLPPLEAMARGCPLIISDIGPLRETCNGAARFVNPHDPLAIAQGMLDVIADTGSWARRSGEGGARYREMSRDAGNRWFDIYQGLYSHES